LSQRENNILLSLTILFLSGIIGIFWQIISYFWQRKLREIWDKKTILVRKIIKFYYLTLILSFVIAFFTPNIFSILNNLIPNYSIFLFGGFNTLILLASPIFWLIYYINLWQQFGILGKLESGKSTNNLKNLI